MSIKITTACINTLLFCISFSCFAQNPFIRNQYTADPSARVIGNKVYVFPSHDIKAPANKNLRENWFCMEDYHVFSSENLTDWTDHGVIVTQNKVPWVRPDNYSMWAPDCIERNGKYYFYFPTFPKDTIAHGSGFTVGVAIADKPEGPYIPEATPIKGIIGIDPNVFIDDDGQAYLYWSAGEIFGAKLKENMVELDSEVKTLSNFPKVGLKEGPYLFKKNGIYYMTYPHVENKTERLEYAISDNPLGPFTFTGVIMDESPTGCWTNHQSIIEFKNQWYLFYHSNDLSPQFDKNRSIRIDSLFFNEDGTIQKVTPTLRGVGLTHAANEIQIDRYSHKSNDNVSIRFIDTLNRFAGWKTVFEKTGGWVQYNSVDFGKKSFTTIQVKAQSTKGGTITVRLNNANGPVIATINIGNKNEWTVYKNKIQQFKPGVQHLFVQLTKGNDVAIDWLRFE